MLWLCIQKNVLILKSCMPKYLQLKYCTCNLLSKVQSKKTKTKKNSRGFPGGAVVENLPANAGDMGSSPRLGGSHMPRSDWAREPQLLSLRVWSLCSATREAVVVRGPRTAMKSGPRSPATAGESPRTEMKTQHSHKLIN